MSSLRVVTIIENPNRKLYVCQKDKNRRYPDLFSLGIDSPINEGESHIEATQRVLKKLNVSSEPRYLFDFVFSKGKSRFSEIVYHARHNGLIRHSREFQWSDWMNVAQIDELSAQNKLCPDSEIIYQRFKRDFYSKI